MNDTETKILRDLLDKFRFAAPEKQAVMLASLTAGINQTKDADVKRWLGELKIRLERLQIERINQRSKVIGGVHVVFMPSRNYKRGFVLDGELKFIFIGAGLSRRERGRHIRRGLKFFKQKEKTDEKK